MGVADAPVAGDQVAGVVEGRDVAGRGGEAGTAPPTSSSTTLPVAERLPPLDDEIPGAVRSADGFLLPITGTDGDVWFLLGACGEDRIEPGAAAVLVEPQHVVLDPGGDADAAAQTNLAVAEATAALLADVGVAVTLTRTDAGRLSATTRGAVGPATGADALVSIHHVEATSAQAGPGPAVFHRADDADSRRLAGLVHEELAAHLAPAPLGFASSTEPGARPLLNQRGDDFFRVLQTSGDVAAVRMELGGVAENDTTLLATEEGREVQARALAEALIRFLVTEEEGSGFIDPAERVRTAPTSNTPGGCS